MVLLALTTITWEITNHEVAGAQEIHLFEPSEDAYASQSNSNSNYGRNEIMSVRSYRTVSESFNHRIYIRFDLTELDQASYVDSSELRLYKCIEGNKVGTRRIEVKRVLGQWQETNITWENKPESAETSPSWEDVSKAENWYKWDVTVEVRSWINGSVQNYGFCLVDSEENSSVDYASVFYSREAYEMHVYRPKLEVKTTMQGAHTEGNVIGPFLLLAAVTVSPVLVILMKIKRRRYDSLESDTLEMYGRQIVSRQSQISRRGISAD